MLHVYIIYTIYAYTILYCTIVLICCMLIWFIVIQILYARGSLVLETSAGLISPSVSPLVHPFLEPVHPMKMLGQHQVKVLLNKCYLPVTIICICIYIYHTIFTILYQYHIYIYIYISYYIHYICIILKWHVRFLIHPSSRKLASFLSPWPQQQWPRQFQPSIGSWGPGVPRSPGPSDWKWYDLLKLSYYIIYIIIYIYIPVGSLVLSHISMLCFVPHAGNYA